MKKHMNQKMRRERTQGKMKQKKRKQVWKRAAIWMFAGWMVFACIPGTVYAEADLSHRTSEAEITDADLSHGTSETEITEADLSHGTSETEITEDMLSLTPPADYQINQSMQAEAKDGLYDRFFLKDAIQTVSIEMDKNNLNYVLQHAAEKPSVMTSSVTIGDETIYYTGFKTKGNYTLEHSVTENPGSDRFSFSINFGKYIKKSEYGAKQNFYGLSKVSFNNFFFDKSMLKEYCAFIILSEMGLPTPQFGLSKLYINGEYYGVYFMVENMDPTILQQYYGVEKSKLSSYLCKPEKTRFIYEDLEEDMSPLYEADPETYEEVQDMLPTVMEWVRRLNCLSQGTDFDGKELDINSQEYLDYLNEIMDVEETTKYFAVHSFLCQMDSMFDTEQNFGLYVDESGRSLMIPWDYDLAFGCYYPCDSESTANYDIDWMFKDVDQMNQGFDGMWDQEGSENRDPDALDSFANKVYEKYPLFHVIYQNDELRSRYHGYLEDCARVAALGGTVEATGETYDPQFLYDRIEAIYEELYEAAAEPLTEHCYYMNKIKQPYAVESARLNLERIIAMRSLGVYYQVHGRDDIIVSGSGCNLETLGNAIQGWTQSFGTICNVDAETGIWFLADYGSDSDFGFWGRGGNAPKITLKAVNTDDEMYQSISEQISNMKEDSLLVYKVINQVKPNGEYQITIPVSPEAVSNQTLPAIYAYQGETLLELEVTLDGNFCTVHTEQPELLILDYSGGAADFGSVLKNIDRKNSLPWILTGAAAMMGVIIGAILYRKKKKNHQS